MKNGVPTEEEGIRRSICDMVLLIFHLVLSSFTFEGVDIHMAQKILDYQIERYPNGARFSLFLCIFRAPVWSRNICHRVRLTLKIFVGIPFSIS